MLDRPDAWLSAIMVWAATWRVSHLLMYEAGPFKVFVHMRALTGVRHDKDTDRPVAWPDGNVFECFLCLTIWVAIAMTLIAWLWWPPIVVLSISAVAIWLEGIYGGSRGD